MITVKFPALDKALQKDLKDVKEDDPRRGIIVLENNAIVFRDHFCLVCNLFDYFTLEAEVEDIEEVNELERILYFMNGKVFSKEFWGELTKGANIKMKEGNLHVENPKYSKDLHYKELEYDLLKPLERLYNAWKQEELPVSAIGIPYGALQEIYSCLSASFKNDVIIFEFNAQDKPVKFTFRARKHFFGYIMPHYDSAQEGFRFDLLEQLAEENFDLLEELQAIAKSKLTPPPPSLLSEIIDVLSENKEAGNINGQFKIV